MRSSKQWRDSCSSCITRDWNQLTAEQIGPVLAKYVAFRKEAFTVDGLRLSDDPGKVLRGKQGRPSVSDGPYSETKEILGGLFIVEAADYDHAVEIAPGHPHLEFGAIEVRHIYGT